MHLSKTLIRQVSIIAHHYGQGWDGDDMAGECRLLLLQLPESKRSQALTICRNKCIDIMREIERKACGSTDNPAFFEPMIYGQIVDKEKYIRHIRDLRLRAIIDQYVDGEKALSPAQHMYLSRHRNLLDRSFEKYLKPISQFMLFYRKVAPFHVRLA